MSIALQIWTLGRHSLSFVVQPLAVPVLLVMLVVVTVVVARVVRMVMLVMLVAVLAVMAVAVVRAAVLAAREVMAWGQVVLVAVLVRARVVVPVVYAAVPVRARMVVGVV